MARWEKAPAAGSNGKPARRTAQERRIRQATRAAAAAAAAPTPPATPPASPAPGPSPAAGEPDTMEVDAAAGAATVPEPAKAETVGSEAIPAADAHGRAPVPPLPRLTRQEAEALFARVRVLVRSPGTAAAERALRELRRYRRRAPVRTLRLLEAEARRFKRTVLAEGIRQLFAGPV